MLLSSDLACLVSALKELNPEDQRLFRKMIAIAVMTPSKEEHDAALDTAVEVLRNDPLEVLEFDLTETYSTGCQEIARKIEVLRESCGISLQDLSEAAQVPLQYLLACESGERYPSHFVREKICKVCGKSLDYLE